VSTKAILESKLAERRHRQSQRIAKREQEQFERWRTEAQARQRRQLPRPPRAAKAAPEQRLQEPATQLEQDSVVVGWTAVALAVLAWCNLLLASQDWSPLSENLWPAAMLGPAAFVLGALACVLSAVATWRNEAGPVAKKGTRLGLLAMGLAVVGAFASLVYGLQGLTQFDNDPPL
jgi:hypothetical protein